MTAPSPDLAWLTVAVRGEGLAANACAQLLAQQGVTVARAARPRRPVPAILLSDAALALLRSVLDRPDLFADRPRVTRRVVAWGTAEAVSLPHGAAVVSESDLEAALARTPGPSGASPATAPSLTIHAGPPFPAPDLRRFGSRRTSTTQVRLQNAADRDACWVEALAQGWLFLTPAENDSAWLLAVGAPAPALLAASRLIAPRIAPIGDPSADFDTSPRMLTRLRGPDWLACGTAAVAFDPICGDGTAQAMREAILGCAVITAIGEGGDREALLGHYEAMLTAAMRRHLRLCAQFYESGGTGDWWRAQMAGLAEGFDWCTRRLAHEPEPRFELHGFRLVAREAVS